MSSVKQLNFRTWTIDLLNLWTLLYSASDKIILKGIELKHCFFRCTEDFYCWNCRRKQIMKIGEYLMRLECVAVPRIMVAFVWHNFVKIRFKQIRTYVLHRSGAAACSAYSERANVNDVKRTFGFFEERLPKNEKNKKKNKKALLSQRRPRDATNIWVPWKVSRVLANSPGYFSRNL